MSNLTRYAPPPVPAVPEPDDWVLAAQPLEEVSTPLDTEALRAFQAALARGTQPPMGQEIDITA